MFLLNQLITELEDLISNLLNKLALWIPPKYYFTNLVVNVWNSLPSHIVSSPTLSTFKSRLGKHNFSSYLLQFTVQHVVFITIVFLFQVFNFSSNNQYCFVLFHCIMLCYCYGSVSDQLGPSAFNKFDFDLICFNQKSS